MVKAVVASFSLAAAALCLYGCQDIATELPDPTSSSGTTTAMTHAPAMRRTTTSTTTMSELDAELDEIRMQQEERNKTVLSELTAEFSWAAAELLWNAFLSGKFYAHSKATEAVVEGSYVLDYDGADCDWAQTSLQHLQKIDFPSMGISIVEGLGEEQLLEALNLGCISMVEQDTLGTLEQVTFPPWGIDSIDGVIDSVFHSEHTGDGVKIYVMDTGVHSQHLEFAGRFEEEIDFTDSGPGDGHGHGTHCAGTAAGANVGVAPKATIISVKVCTPVPNGCSSAAAFAGITWIIEQRKKHSSPMVVSASIGFGRSPIINKEFKKMVDAGITVVVSAMNDGKNAFWSSPASEESVITVGAMHRDGVRADFSNYGSLIDIWAPGVDVWSAWIHNNAQAFIDSDGYKSISGTSMACPHVAGVAAQLLEWHREWNPKQVRSSLVDMTCKYDGGRFRGFPNGTLRAWSGSDRLLSCPHSLGSCEQSNDDCLQSLKGWEKQTCQDSAEDGSIHSSYCESYPQQMGLCCAKACIDRGFNLPCEHEPQHFQYHSVNAPSAATGGSCTPSDDSCLQQFAGWAGYSCAYSAEHSWKASSYCETYPDEMSQCCAKACLDRGYKMQCNSQATPAHAGMCSSSSDSCLQNLPGWSESDTCYESAEQGWFQESYCKTYPEDMGKCCAKDCLDNGFAVPCE